LEIAYLKRDREQQSQQMQKLYSECNDSVEDYKGKFRDMVQSMLAKLEVEEGKRLALRKTLDQSTAENTYLRGLLSAHGIAVDAEVIEQIRVEEEEASARRDASEAATRGDSILTQRLLLERDELEERLRNAEEMIQDLLVRRKVEITSMTRMAQLMSENIGVLNSRLQKYAAAEKGGRADPSMSCTVVGGPRVGSASSREEDGVGGGAEDDGKDDGYDEEDGRVDMVDEDE
jgi:hypothetical protein